MKNITIIGGGPAALILAAELDPHKYTVTIYEKKKAVGRKFLVAGEGGLNLTYNSSVDELISHYAPSAFIEPVLRKFSNEDLRNWFKTIEVPTFLGSSNRVFPTKELKPIDVLNKIVHHVTTKGVSIVVDTEWTGWSPEGNLTFTGLEDVATDITVFALGGASWKVTGSDGLWATSFESRGIKEIPFRAANCAFGVDWDNNFVNTHAGKPLKNIAITFNRFTAKGELVVSSFGLEGNAIYALSNRIQEAFTKEESCTIHLDLKPTMTEQQILVKYKKSKLTKVTDILKEDLNLDRTAIGLLKQFTDKETFMNPELLAATIKKVAITLSSVDHIDKAISTLGGIALDEIEDDFQLSKMPATYVIGEMLDWYAPTGGYLLQGCFSMGFSLAQSLNKIK
jgi:uncharacterized flavoprotein (TIGR03862 family)